ncbi:uncharacterized protein OCT59_024295 [Rhizophagus irregularis]|uniref:Uncharacterized protein n=1 Tax=Rhizophagus irregularis (strain DAOM 197198w) TaxID=1432141 RepID=A0A015JQ89_RHIIW|nr:hypothetical protein RirG_095920 [Rhizophagus irregularis DAOM 197198w]UZO03895.1 hypothetical protein OCT59_024295 [Rhizophagus irregularis]GBC22519.1 hypothetical protein GLOIN_2v1874621 [Rhizophagus irregularis DAOM 181602=DAOM 197198]
MPRSKEVIEKYNQLNSEFSNRISVIGGKVDTSNKDKAKEKVVDSESEKLNGNKKCVVTIQGGRDDSDNE